MSTGPEDERFGPNGVNTRDQKKKRMFRRGELESVFRFFVKEIRKKEMGSVLNRKNPYYIRNPNLLSRK